ncbi:armadillo-type protein [Mycena rosella]|uniref:Armadillo-type protein n=1 Tax=Mycena rosella TaxID=1033263 RepID=A0AAD7D7Q4_MYCRO|nr:armadillo-type protein [Mycena rosella]
MEAALEKIRPHTSSALPHQKSPANLLIALESTFRDQHTESSPTAYFAALLTTLDSTIQKGDLGLDEGDILPAELYLLALVAPFVSAPVVRTNLNTILTLTAPLFPSLTQHAPALRSQLTLYHVMLQSLDRSQLETQGIRQTFASILHLCLDPRPKVRRKAADTVRDVLATPPAPLSRHPYAERVAEWIKSALSEVSAGPFARPKSSKAAEPVAADSAIHILALLRPVLPNLPPPSLPAITNLLLTLPRLGNQYLSQSAYSILSELFALPIEDESINVNEQISEVLKAVLASPPSKADATLSPAWLQVLGTAMISYNLTDSNAAAAELGRVWKTIWAFLESTEGPTKVAAARSLDLLTQCITPAMIESALLEKDARSTLGKIIAQTTKALDSLAYAGAIPQLLSVISSLITNMRHKVDGTKSAAEALLLPLIQHVGELRVQKGFEFKEDADATIAAAMRVLGPQALLTALPLNLEPEDRQEGREPRAYLLPLLPQPHPSPLSHFISYFVPLSERMFGLQQTAETDDKQSQAKLWSVLIGQIWTGLAGYCWATPDLRESLNPTFSALLSGLLYGQPELRPAVLRALKIMVDSNVAVASGAVDPAPNNPNSLSPAEATLNIVHLRAQAESWLAVLFNVFGSVGRDSRGIVGDVITAWAAIAGEQEIAKAHAKVVELLKANLANQPAQPHRNSSIEGGSEAATTQDLVILLLPNLSPADAQQLFQLCLSAPVLSAKDNGVQKRGYKILTRLLESEKVLVDAEVVLKQLDELADGLAPAAKKDRFNLLSLLIPQLPSSAMHVIPSLIPEAVLGTKEPSEKARTAAFDVVVAMGRKMNEGGVVKRNLMDGMDEDGAEDATANIQEFMTMVAGGLAGASPHMISATVTAISRLVFEFKDAIPPSMHTEILSTLLVFISSANREIVKSILGFVKLAIHTLPADLIRPHLPTLVPALLGWSHDHKNHFKAKVRHIFERMLRRFGWDEVYGCAGEEEAKKVLVNIKKRKERAKRKKANGRDDEDEPVAKPVAGDAFEDVLYGSESELEDSDDDEPQQARAAVPRKKKGAEQGARIRMDDDEPMDLLQGVASRITQGTSARRRKPGQDAARFKTDDDTGKMIIDEEGDDARQADAGVDVAGTAYRENITSVDGFTRGANGRVKFNKDTKKRRRDNEEADGDVEMGDGEAGPGKFKKAKRRIDTPKFGHEFKAKKAGGDVKKGGVDPYAYMSLSQAAKKSGQRKEKMGIVGKR